MYSVLIVAPDYTQLQHLKNLLLSHPDQFRIAGTADNSVVGMSMIEASQPDLVIMPSYMSFWNAEDLINYLLPKGIAPHFVILLEEDEPAAYGAAVSQVSVLLPTMLPTEQQLLRAIQEAVSRRESQGSDVLPQQTYHPAIQHSLEVMELLTGLTPMRTGSAQMEFGRLRVGRKNCWLLLSAPAHTAQEPYHFFAQMETLEHIFERLHTFLTPLGSSEICIYQGNNLCILLASNQITEPDWEGICQSINRLLAPLGVPELCFEISDEALPFEHWSAQCRALLRLRGKRFFYAPIFLQDRHIRAYAQEVTQAQIHEQLSALSLAVQNLQREETARSLERLQTMISHSFSQELYSFVTTQLVVLYSRLCYTHGLPTRDNDIRTLQYPGVAETFTAFRQLFLSICDHMSSLHGNSNPIITEACAYISQHLSETLTLEIVSAHVHVSTTYLSRLFKKETGSTFNDHINQHRTRRAAQLLETPYRITDIAGMVGFDNAKYFSQVFRKYTGKTPQQYRNDLRKEQSI